MRAALTGHLVFSTLHTNDAPSTIDRLIDMGIPSYLVASCVRLVMAQRMVRKVCTNCREEIKLPSETLQILGLTEDEVKDTKIYAAKGCNECNSTGYSGRTGIFEVMPMSQAIERMILAKASNMDIRQQAIAEGMLTLRTAALGKLKNGVTTVAEVMAVTAL
ncbi:MAG: ATPase, T2SS/T4P/T4SS family [Candidatus Zixiibacteriota bacterium]